MNERDSSAPFIPSTDEGAPRELSAEESAFLSSARAGLSPSNEAVRRLKWQIDATLLDTTTNPREPSRGLGRHLRVRGLGLFALGVGLGTWGGYWWGQHDAKIGEPVAAPSTRHSNTTIAQAPTAAFTPHAPVVTAPYVSLQIPSTHDVGVPSPKRPSRVKAGDAAAVRADRSSRSGRNPMTSPDELLLVQRVQRALARREPRLALAFLEELDNTLPNGRLLEERAAGKVIALCMSGSPRASGAFQAFKAQYSGSVHLPRAVATCATKQSKNNASDSDESESREQE